ncbi:hypothetical protein NRF20_03400 [Streptomyces sp. R-74717]|uniref:hypothetical protein n=1 Tax=Streptomyces TaxID=1883 RepID=UPI003799C588
MPSTWRTGLAQRRAEADAAVNVPLAVSLDHLSRLLGTLGNVEEGLAAAMEAVAT